MDLMPMKYKNYVWPHNPRVYSISYERKVAVDKVPFGRYVMRDMGMTCRVLKGEGEFCGEGAYDEFKKLASVFYSNGPGKLWHPLWVEANAYFVKLSLKQEPLPDYVSYTFEFWEAYDGYTETARTVKTAAASAPGQIAASASSAGAKTHTVESGDTMWAIAKANGMTLSALIALNQQIKNPNLIRPGQIIKLG